MQSNRLCRRKCGARFARSCTRANPHPGSLHVETEALDEADDAYTPSSSLRRRRRLLTSPTAWQPLHRVSTGYQ